MKDFLELIEQNEELKKRVEELDGKPEAEVAEYIALAAEYGVTLTEADFKQAQTAELSEDELDTVAGGKFCACVGGGGGTGDDASQTKTCACVMGGGGQRQNGEGRCACIIYGEGYDTVC